MTNSVQVVWEAQFSFWHQYFIKQIDWRKSAYFRTFIALVGIIHLTPQYPVIGINNIDKSNYIEEEEHNFYLSNKYFSAPTGINYLQSNVFFLKKMSIFSNFFAHAQ